MSPAWKPTSEWEGDEGHAILTFLDGTSKRVDGIGNYDLPDNVTSGILEIQIKDANREWVCLQIPFSALKHVEFWRGVA